MPSVRDQRASGNKTPGYIMALAAVLAIVALGAGGYLVVDHLNKGKDTHATLPPPTTSASTTTAPAPSETQSSAPSDGPSAPETSQGSVAPPTTETATVTETTTTTQDPQAQATNELNSWAATDEGRLDYNDTWGVSLGMMWPGVEDSHVKPGKLQASDILDYYRGLQQRFGSQVYLVKANHLGKQNSNHAKHPDAWQLVVPLNATNGSDADQWCRDNMGDDTYTCARQKINEAHH